MSSLAPYWVSSGGVVHAAGCHFIRTASIWGGANVFPHDRGCRVCLGGELPEDDTT